MSCRVLMVDDNENDLLFTRIALQRSGVDYEVHAFERAREALELLSTRPNHGIDLILLDINMPVMDGFEAASQLRPQFPDATLLILTANVQASSRNQAEELGVHFLAKPISAVIARQALALWGSEHA